MSSRYSNHNLTTYTAISGFLLMSITILTFGRRGIPAFIILSVLFFIAGFYFTPKGNLKITIRRSAILLLPTLSLFVFIFILWQFFPIMSINIMLIFELIPAIMISILIATLIKYNLDRHYLRNILLFFLWIGLLVFAIDSLIPRWIFYHYTTKEAYKSIPQIFLFSLDNQLIKDKDLKNRVLLLDFWDLNCGFCIKRFPEVEELKQKFKNRSDVKIIAVNTGRRDSIQEIQKFLRNKHYSFNFYLDKNSQLCQKLGIQGVPICYLIDKKGKIRLIHQGYAGKDEKFVYFMTKEIMRLL
ncbi:MAG: TlpA family protein disulfide reductase [Microscillaceae bacterium]|nr:TlpA family protein disulfide reductase [Microscillaceae bacterium]